MQSRFAAIAANRESGTFNNLTLLTVLHGLKIPAGKILEVMSFNSRTTMQNLRDDLGLKPNRKRPTVINWDDEEVLEGFIRDWHDDSISNKAIIAKYGLQSADPLRAKAQELDLPARRLSHCQHRGGPEAPWLSREVLAHITRWRAKGDKFKDIFDSFPFEPKPNQASNIISAFHRHVLSKLDYGSVIPTGQDLLACVHKAGLFTSAEIPELKPFETKGQSHKPS